MGASTAEVRAKQDGKEEDDVKGAADAGDEEGSDERAGYDASRRLGGGTAKTMARNRGGRSTKPPTLVVGCFFFLSKRLTRGVTQNAKK